MPLPTLPTLRQLGLLPPGRRALLAVAAPVEARAALRARSRPEFDPPSPWAIVQLDDDTDLLITGIGKANAAGAVALRFDPARHALLINAGVAGALPAPAAPRLGELILASRSVYADEGVAAPDGFHDIASLGFAPGPADHLGVGVAPDPRLLEALRPRADSTGVVATVSACAGTDALARAVAQRTAALAEAMEGAAAGFALLHLARARALPPVPFLEARAISNTTGDRPAQVWRLDDALRRLESFLRSL